MSNPFAVEAWEAEGDAYLRAGDHVVTVAEADGTTTSSGGYPQIELRLENDGGSIRDWIVITPATYGKIAQVIQAIGAELPDENQHISKDDHRIAQAYLDAQWVGKQVGIIAREEPGYNDPSKMWTKIKGYVSVDKIVPGATPPVSNAGDVQGGFGTNGNSDIPF